MVSSLIRYGQADTLSVSDVAVFVFDFVTHLLIVCLELDTIALAWETLILD